MFCSACANETDADPCTHCGSPPLLEGRYRLEHLLERGARGITWAATRLSDGELVAVKAVPLPPELDATDQAHVPREVAVLRQVRHPGIPQLFDAFQVRSDAGMRIQYQVLEFVSGQTLAETLAEGPLDEAEVLGVLEEVLSVLVRLHGLSPPIVHGDLKPSNLMRRPDGSLVVIDFAAVRVADGSTDAGPRSDLHALGVTAVALLRGEPPHTLLDSDGQLRWQDHVTVSEDTGALLSALLAAQPDGRASTARTALAWVRRLRAPVEAPVRPPPNAEAPRAVALAERPPRKGMVLVAAVAAVLIAVSVVGFLAIVGSSTPSSTRASPPRVVEASAAEICGGEPCAPVANFALRQLQLGQTVEQARAAFPELADGVEGSGSSTRVQDLIDLELPGPIWRVRTLIDGHLAGCDLHFSVEETLSRVRCEIDDPGTDKALTELGQDIAAELEARHGPVSPEEDDMDLMLHGWKRRWQWSDSTGLLSLKVGRTPIFGGRVGLLEVVTAAHQREVVRARQAAELAERTREQQRQDDKAQRKAQEMLELIESIQPPAQGL